jgi:hypothetical protein
MTSTITLFCCLGVLLVSGCQDRPQQQPQTPVSANRQIPVPDFVGFSLGKSPPHIKMCNPESLYGHKSDGQEICWWGASGMALNKSLDVVPDGSYMIEFPPHKIPNGIKPNGSIIVIDHLVHRITLDSNGLLSQLHLEALLKSKYGEPESSDSKTVTFNGGDHALSTDATWIYRDGYIWFQGITSSKDNGSIRASTYEADDWVKRGFGQNADSF